MEFLEELFMNINYLAADLLPQVPWWNKRTRMERRFLLFAGALTVVAIALGAGLVLMVRDKVRRVCCYIIVAGKFHLRGYITAQAR